MGTRNTEGSLDESLTQFVPSLGDKKNSEITVEERLVQFMASYEDNNLRRKSRSESLKNCGIL